MAKKSSNLFLKGRIQVSVVETLLHWPLGPVEGETVLDINSPDAKDNCYKQYAKLSSVHG